MAAVPATRGGACLRVPPRQCFVQHGGASGFLVKDIPSSDVIEAVRLAAGGDAIVSPSVTRNLVSHCENSAAADRAQVATERLSAVTDREREVAVALGAGPTNCEIAPQLFMSESTAKAHVSRLLAKLDVTSRVHIAVLVHDATHV